MHKPIVIIGIGEMASVFAKGFLRSGYPVYPITRDMDIGAEAQSVPEPEMVLVAVAEQDLHPTLDEIPPLWRDRLALLQNELLPKDWQTHQLENPTVISVWFEKKKGQDAKVLIPSPVYGPKAEIFKIALESIDIPCRVLIDSEELLYELVRKNVYILTTNIAGLETGGTVSELWARQGTLAREVANEVIDVQQWLAQQNMPRDRLMGGMLEAFEGDPEHKCMGRSATARLRRALTLADQAGLPVDRLREIAKAHL